jgi:hypothetical protein
MKFMLIINMNPAIWQGLSEEDQNAVGGGHGAFQEKLKAAGEMISTYALADPSTSAVVHVRNGASIVTDGPYVESKEFLAGFYLIEAENRERALEIAAQMPETRVEGWGIEVREVIHAASAND